MQRYVLVLLGLLACLNAAFAHLIPSGGMDTGSVSVAAVGRQPSANPNPFNHKGHEETQR